MLYAGVVRKSFSPLAATYARASLLHVMGSDSTVGIVCVAQPHIIAQTTTRHSPRASYHKHGMTMIRCNGAAAGLALCQRSLSSSLRQMFVMQITVPMAQTISTTAFGVVPGDQILLPVPLCIAATLNSDGTCEFHDLLRTSSNLSGLKRYLTWLQTHYANFCF
jgi:hypothetical protein